MSEIYMTVRQNERKEIEPLPSCKKIAIRARGKWAHFWQKFGHDADIYFHMGILQPDVWYECSHEAHQGKSVSHADLVEEFMEAYLVSEDGANIVRKSDLEREARLKLGVDDREASALMGFKSGKLSLDEFLAVIERQESEVEAAEEAPEPAFVRRARRPKPEPQMAEVGES